MKKLLFALVIALCTLACSKSSNTTVPVGIISASQVPSPVMSAYTSRYPAASGQIEWEKEDSNTYKVKFFVGAQHWQAIFKADGTFITEQQV